MKERKEESGKRWRGRAQRSEKGRGMIEKKVNRKRLGIGQKIYKGR